MNSDVLNREDELVSVADEVSIEEPVKFPEANLEKEKRVPEKLHEENIENGLVIRGYFTQKVRGGLVHKKQQVFVPESIARKLNLKQETLLNVHDMVLRVAGHSIALKLFKELKKHRQRNEKK